MSSRGFVLGGVACAAVLSAAVPAHAGLTAEQMRARHLELLALDAGEPSPSPPPHSGRVAVLLGEAPFARVPFRTDAARPFTSAPLVAPDLPRGAGVAFEQTLLEPEANPLGARLRFGALYSKRDHRVRFTGSEAEVPLGPGSAYVSNASRHWGPGWFGSTILDSAAPPLAAAGWRLGDGVRSRWSADVFAGRLRGEQTHAHPWLIGMRLEWRPTPAWTFGLARTMQFGGEGRDESPRNLLRGLLGDDTVGRDGVTSDNQPGNQELAFDVRYARRVGDVALGTYAQLTAEDKGKFVPTRRMPLVGVDAATRFGALSLRAIAEFVQTRAGSASGLAYTHDTYQAGYVNRNEPLGHPIGGDARLASLGLLLDQGPWFALVALHGGRALAQSQRFIAGDALEGADAALHYAARRDLTLGVALHHWRAGASGRGWGEAFAEYRWR